MFTVEFEPDASVITCLDNHDQFDDVELTICDDGSVFIRQHIQDVEETNIIYMSYQQLFEMVAGLNKTEGAYQLHMEE